MSAEHARLLFLWAGSSSGPQRKPSLPNTVTSTKGGPLSLCGKSHHASGSHPTTHPAPQPQHHPHRQRTLTKFPVLMTENPMEVVEKELGTLSCAQLMDTLQDLNESKFNPPQVKRMQPEDWSPAPTPRDKLPKLLPLPHPHQEPHQRPNQRPSKRMQDSTGPHMDITITYSRHHHTPGSFTMPTPRPNALTNLSVLRGSPTYLPAGGHPTELRRPSASLGALSYRPSPLVKLPSQLAGGTSGGRVRRHRLAPMETILKGKGLATTHKPDDGDSHHGL